MSNYAVVQTGGKQYRVSPGDVLRVEKLDASPGDTVELSDVRLVVRDDSVVVGTPRVDGAKVVAEVQGSDKAKKVVVFRFKPKVRHRKKQGHRQPYTEMRVTDIQLGGN